MWADAHFPVRDVDDDDGYEGDEDLACVYFLCLHMSQAQLLSCNF